MTPTSFIRPASLLDMLGVVDAMSATERGQMELLGFALVTGTPVSEWAICGLMQNSVGFVALASNADPGRALMVAGFIPQRVGVLRTWMLATDEAWSAHGKELTVYAEAGIVVQLQQNAHRIETICPDSHVAAKAWYPRLGLKQEATLAKYCTDGSDAALFVRLRETT